MFEKSLELFKNMFYVDKNSLKYGYSIYLIIFILYLEFGTSLGGVWLRKNSMNKTVFSPRGILGFFTKPFTLPFFWYPKYWDLNYYIGGFITSNLIYKLNLINKYLK